MNNKMAVTKTDTRTEVVWVSDAESPFQGLCTVEGGRSRTRGTETLGGDEMVKTLVVRFQ